MGIRLAAFFAGKTPNTKPTIVDTEKDIIIIFTLSMGTISIKLPIA